MRDLQLIVRNVHSGIIFMSLTTNALPYVHPGISMIPPQQATTSTATPASVAASLATAQDSPTVKLARILPPMGAQPPTSNRPF